MFELNVKETKVDSASQSVNFWAERLRREVWSLVRTSVADASACPTPQWRKSLPAVQNWQ